MGDDLASNIDLLASVYAERFCHELDAKPFDRSLLRRFAQTIPPGPVCDLGCGPGHVAAHLASLGVAVFGMDLSPQMIAEGRGRYPSIAFQVGDMLNLPIETGSLSGVVALYSIIHLRPDSLAQAFREMSRVLRPGGLLLVSFHKGHGELHVDNVFGTKAWFDLTLFEADDVAPVMEDAGLSIAETTVRRPYEVEYPTQRVYVLSHRRGP